MILSRFLIGIVDNAVLPRVNAQLRSNQQFMWHLGQARAIEEFASVFNVVHFNCIVLQVMHQLVLALDLGMA